MLRVKNLTTGYDGVPVVFDVSLEVNQAEFVAIVGSNGAGKTTILRTISGLLKPISGEIEFEGKQIHKLSAHEIVRLGIAHVPEGRHVFGKMSVKDNLLMGAYTLNDRAKVNKLLNEVFEIFPRLKERKSKSRDAVRWRTTDARRRQSAHGGTEIDAR